MRGVLLSPIGDNILQEFYVLYMTRFSTYKIATPTQTKPRKGVGLRQIKTCSKVPIQVNFLDDDILHCFLQDHPTSRYPRMGTGWRAQFDDRTTTDFHTHPSGLQGFFQRQFINKREGEKIDQLGSEIVAFIQYTCGKNVWQRTTHPLGETPFIHIITIDRKHILQQ